MVFQIFGALAEFERNLIRERTQAGLAAARARGRKGGRPKALNQTKIEVTYKLYDEKSHTIKVVARGDKNPASSGTKIRHIAFEYGK